MNALSLDHNPRPTTYDDVLVPVILRHQSLEPLDIDHGFTGERGVVVFTEAGHNIHLVGTRVVIMAGGVDPDTREAPTILPVNLPGYVPEGIRRSDKLIEVMYKKAEGGS